MRIEELRFHRVGQWRELQPLILGPRITLVLGDNEAGKSTARRAVEAVLFGTRRELVAPLTSEAVFHASASVRFRDGMRLEWTRKGKAVEPEEVAPLLAQRLPPSLEGRYRDLFGLGYAQVRASEREFLAERGAIGTLLFAAGSGIDGAQLAEAIDAIADRLKELESGAQNRDGLKRRLKQLEALDSDEKGATFRDFAAQHARLEECRKATLELADRIHALKLQRERLLAFARGLPIWRELTALERRLQSLEASGPIPSREWGRTLQEIRLQLRAAAEGLKRAKESARKEREAFEKLQEAPALGALLGELEQLRPRAVEAAKDRKARDELAAKLAEGRRRLTELLGQLGVRPAPERLVHEAGQWLLDAKRARNLEALVREDEELQRAEAQGELDRREAAESLARAERALDGQREWTVDGLVQAQALVARMAEQDNTAEGASRAQRTARANAVTLATRLGLDAVPGTANELPRPDRALIEAIWKRLEQARWEAEQSRERREEAEERAATAERELENQRARLGGAPTAEELRSAREAREQLWSELKASWTGGKAPADPAGLVPLSERFELRVARADEVADRRFTDAARVGACEQAQRAADEHRERLEKLRSDEAERSAVLEKVQLEWAGAWAFLKAPPADHTGWLADLTALAGALAEAERAAGEQQDALARRAQLLEDARRLLAQELPDCAAQSSTPSLSTAIGLELERRREQQKRLAAAKATLESHRERLDRAGRRLEENASQRAAWRVRWETEVAALPPERERDLASVRAWLKLHPELLRTLSEVRDAEERDDSLEEALVAFERDVRRLQEALREKDPASAHAPSLDAVEVARRLGDYALGARELITRRTSAEKSLASRRAEEESAKASHQEQVEALVACWKTGGFAGEPDEAGIDAALESVEEASALRTDLKQRRRELEREWPVSVADALEEIGGRSEEQLAATAAELENEQRSLEGRREEKLKEQGQLQDVLDRLENPEKAGQERAQALANARTAALERAEEVAELKAAKFLLERAREEAARSADPLIALASRYFATLTGERYVGLSIDRTGREPALLAIPAVGDELYTSQLSDGTLDQLWLALRLAVAKQAAAETPLPLVLDDVFVHFDDGRTTAALKLLAELSEELQVVLFTHHDHLVDLARLAIPEQLTEIVLARPEHERNRVLPQERERIERPPAPVLQLDLGLGEARKRAPVEQPGGDLAELVVQVLAAAGRPLSKAEVLEGANATGSDLSGSWNPLIRQLKENGRVVQVGEKRGTKYTLAESSGARDAEGA